MKLVKMVKSSCAAFLYKLVGLLREIGNLSTKGDPDVWIRPAVKPDGTEYHEMVLCNVDDVFSILVTPMKNIEGIKALFKFKGYKAEVPDMYLGVLIQKVETVDGKECWMMSAEKYANTSVENIKLKIAKSNCRISSCCDTHMTTTYYPSKDITKKMQRDCKYIRS